MQECLFYFSPLQQNRVQKHSSVAIDRLKKHTRNNPAFWFAASLDVCSINRKQMQWFAFSKDGPTSTTSIHTALHSIANIKDNSSSPNHNKRDTQESRVPCLSPQQECDGRLHCTPAKGKATVVVVAHGLEETLQPRHIDPHSANAFPPSITFCF